MRDKEAIENERKSLVRNLEKQAKLVERLVDTEKNLSSQVVSCPRTWNVSGVHVIILGGAGNTDQETQRIPRDSRQWCY